MAENGNVYTFNIEEVSLLDVNELIDIGYRFTLKAGLDEDDYDDIEEVLQNAKR